MKRKIIFMIAALLGMLTVYGQPKPIPGQYIVLLKESSAKPIVKNQRQNINREQKVLDNKLMRDKNILKLKDVQAKRSIKPNAIIHEFGDVLVGFTAKLSKAEFDNMKRDPDVADVYQDYIVELGPSEPEKNPPDVGLINPTPENENTISLSGPYNSFYEAVVDNTYVNHGFMPAQYVSCAITMAGGFIDGSTKTKWIWILDTGINLNHPDLNVQTSATFAKSFIPGQTVEDGKGHGTHCAGIAAAKNNTIGVVGVSAGAKVVPVKVLDNSGSGSTGSILAGLNHVAMYDIPGDVVSMSLGGYPWSNCENAIPAIRDAIRNLGNAGTYVCIAAGNEYGDAAKSLPGCINGNRVYTIGCINCNRVCCDFSNFNAGVVDWVAVGQSVYSTYKNGGYATMSGTSMSTPVVAGIIHARNGPPVSGGIVNCKGTNYKIAHR
jgi:subtilisin family serine protease